MEFTLLVPFMLSVAIAFIVFIMCVVLMIDIKVKTLVKEVINISKILEKQLSALNEENKPEEHKS